MIQKGDEVELLDDTLTGTVQEVKGDRAVIETDDGFVMSYPINKLIKKMPFQINPSRLREVMESEIGSRQKPRKKGRKQRDEKPMEVDLHIEELVSSTKNMSDFEMLNVQLTTAKQRLEFAIQHHIQRLVFIHGVGKGVLRMELETLFRRYDQVEFYDAEFSRYGRGATEVYIYQNF